MTPTDEQMKKSLRESLESKCKFSPYCDWCSHGHTYLDLDTILAAVRAAIAKGWS